MLGFLDKIAEQFQGRIERLRNEKMKLEKERDSLFNQTCTASNADRMQKIDSRITEINGILANNAKD